MSPMKLMRRLDRAALVLALGLLAPPAVADEYHYQGSPVGARAAAMGGAFTGLANDTSAAFYNPAGLVLGTGTELSLSTSVYGIARDQIAGSEAVQPPTFLAFPSTFAVVKTPFWAKSDDPTPRHRYGLAVLVTDFTKIARQGLSQGQEQLYKVTDTTTYAGLAYAYRPSPRLSFGAAVWLVDRSLVRFEETSAGAGATDFVLDRRELEGSDLGAQVFLGALFHATSRLSLGLTLRTPTVDFGGSLKLNSFSKRPSTPLEEQSTDQGVFTSQIPFSATLGAALRLHPRLLVSADLSLYAPTGAYRALQAPFMSETVDKGAVVNGAVGAELLLTRRVPLRLGFYTDRSSRAGAGLSGLGGLDPDLQSLTGSIGYETERTAIVGGGALEWGGASAGGVALDRQEVRWWVAGSYRL